MIAFISNSIRFAGILTFVFIKTAVAIYRFITRWYKWDFTASAAFSAYCFMH